MKSIDVGLPVLCTGFMVLAFAGLSSFNLFFTGYAGIGIVITLVLMLVMGK